MKFSAKLGENVLRLIERVKGNKATLILLDGGLGEGKTTLAVLVADAINEKNGLPPISLDNDDHPQFAQGGDEFIAKLTPAFEKGYPVIVYDEAGDFSNRSFISKGNKDLYRVFNVYRAFKIIIVMCLPSYYDLDPGLWRLNVVRILIHCHGRTAKCGFFDAYSLKNIIYMRQRVGSKKIPPAFSYRYGQVNFTGRFHDLDPARSRQLDGLGRAKKMALVLESAGMGEEKKLPGKAKKEILPGKPEKKKEPIYDINDDDLMKLPPLAEKYRKLLRGYDNGEADPIEAIRRELKKV